MRLWELTEFDAVLYVDSDVEVLGSVAPAFDLPTDFAVAMDPNKEGYSCAPPHNARSLALLATRCRKALLSGQSCSRRALCWWMQMSVSRSCDRTAAASMQCLG